MRFPLTFFRSRHLGVWTTPILLVIPFLTGADGNGCAPGGPIPIGSGSSAEDAGGEGGRPIDAADAGGEGGRPIDAGADASGPAPDCPASLPEAGSACTPVLPPQGGTFGGTWPCEYGSDPHCTTVADCAATGPSAPFQWFLYGPDPSCAGNSAACPATFGALANGAVCPAADSCSYPEGRCACIKCTGPQATEWECEPWQTPTGCPEPRPLFGTACANEGQECDYALSCNGSLNGGPNMVCNGGYWGTGGPAVSCAVVLCGQ
jgi:hypothetical protein